MHVLDANDNGPHVESLWLSGVIRRGSNPNSLVMDEAGGQPLRLRSTDPDTGQAGEVTYRFIGPGAEAYSGLLIIDSKTGVIRLRSEVDALVMKRPTHLLTIEAADRGEPIARTSDALIRVRIRFDDCDGMNIAPPHFPSSTNPLVVSIFLPTYQGAKIARFTAVGPNLNNFVRGFGEFE